jgi:adenine-specific DNA-methyltransferase
MAFELKYMGTKRRLAHLVAHAVDSAKPGIFFDVFAGMCAVGDALGMERTIWTNDIQLFAAKAAAAIFTFQQGPVHFLEIAEAHADPFSANESLLKKEFGARLEKEADALATRDLRSLVRYLEASQAEYQTQFTERKRQQYAAAPATSPYMLFTLLYADTYFGLSQCVEIDSIIFSVHQLAKSGTVNPEQSDWLLLALGQAMLRTSSTVGHFAQYLMPKQTTLSRFVAQRERSVRDEWFLCLSTLAPRGTRRWRQRNRAFNADSIEILQSLTSARQRPSVVYADPPYTDDQYSRYYHLLETVFLYDYPKTSSKGRYRDGRFQTPFSQRGRAVQATRILAQSVADLGAHLVLSYPHNGLLHQLGSGPLTILRESFKIVKTIASVAARHSTFGASMGSSHIVANEILYHAIP